MEPHKRYSGIDGLRAVAVILVVGYHFFPRALPGGFIGVDIFFVISGFVITTVLTRSRPRDARASDRSVLLAFWRNRARRILPALVMVVLTCATIAAFAHLTGDELTNQLLGAITFSSNWLSIQADANNGPPSLFTHLWSLAIEEQFYLLWPVVLLVLWRIVPRYRSAVLLLLSLVSAALMAAQFLSGADQTRVYFGTDTHVFGLALGAALAVAAPVLHRPAAGTSPPRRSWWILGSLSFAALIAASVAFHDDDRIPYLGGLFAVSAATAALILSIVASPAVARRLESPLLRAIGTRSYGLYLWHWPLLFLTRTALERAFGVTPSQIAVAAIAIPLTVALAVVSFRFVEQPILSGGFTRYFSRMRMSFLRSPRSRFAGGAGALAVVASIACIGTVLVAPATSSVPGSQFEGHGVPLTSPARSPVPAPAPSPLPEPTDDGAAAPITAIGDSAMLVADSELHRTLPRIEIFYAVDRAASFTPELLKLLRGVGQLRDTVVVGIGTDRNITPATLDAIRSEIGRHRQLVLVNVGAHRPWAAPLNVGLADYAAEHPMTLLVDWEGVISTTPAPLGYEPTQGDGDSGQLYAAAIRSTLSLQDQQ